MTLQLASVPKLAKIVDLLGGWDSILTEGRAMGAGICISMDREMVIISNDEPGKSRNEDHPDHCDIVFPDDNGPDHTYKTLLISMLWEDKDHWHVEVGLWAKCNGDPYAERSWLFYVPKDGSTGDRWYVHSTRMNAPFMFGIVESASESPAKARELAAEAEEWDREVIIVGCCLELVQSLPAAG